MARRKKERVIRQQPDRRANRTILIRTLVLMGIFGVAVFVPLFFQLWNIQIEEYDKYRELVADQQTKDSTVEANRGTIYDSTGTPLAISVPSTMSATISPDRRASRPTTTRNFCSRLGVFSLSHWQYEAVNLTRSMGVSASPGVPPMVPRMPEMDLISVMVVRGF